MNYDVRPTIIATSVGRAVPVDLTTVPHPKLATDACALTKGEPHSRAARRERR